MISILMIGASLLGLILTATVALWLGARWFGERPSFWRALVAIVLLGIALTAMRTGADMLRQPLWEFMIDHSLYPIDSWLLLGAQIVVGVFLVWLIARLVLWVPFASAIMASLPVLLLAIVALLTVPLLVKPYFVESVRLHSGSMCPTLLGLSQTATCSQCGAVAYTPWVTEPMPGDELGRYCTCSACSHTARSLEITPRLVEPDAFVVNKLLTPQRWDLVLYRATHIRSMDGGPVRIRFVKRVIGLPGDEVVLKEGGVWINGARLTPPDEIAGLQFLDMFEDRYPILWGSAQKPAKLGPNEYFVVGDYGYHSDDSRTWRNHIDGYSPFGLPASHIDGVVDLRYGPLGRWHIFR